MAEDSSGRPLILLSNDDGYFAPGLRALQMELVKFAAVIVVAPETEQSTTSHALSLHRPLRLREVAASTYAIDGTPADCIYVALHAGTTLLPRLPDVVVAGLNNGLNLGQDVMYSGTVAAAREGALRGIPAVAASAAGSSDLAKCAELCARLAAHLIEKPPGEPTLLNLNIPAPWTGELRATTLGNRLYDERVHFREDPRGRPYLWLGGAGPMGYGREPGTDTEAASAGAASLTPLVLDLTARDRAAANGLRLADLARDRILAQR